MAAKHETRNGVSAASASKRQQRNGVININQRNETWRKKNGVGVINEIRKKKEISAKIIWREMAKSRHQRNKESNKQ